MIHPLLLLLLISPLQNAALAPGQVPATTTVDTTATVGTPPVSSAVRALRADLDRVIERPGWSNDRWGVLAVSLDSGDTLYAHAPDRPLAPASNMKLFTTAAALYYLGPQYRYSTYMLATGPIENGVLNGDLILYGTGDPTLSDRFHGSKLAVWDGFADVLNRLGVREVRGDVVGDASYFGGSGVGRGWRESYMNTWYAAPAGALSFNDNVVTLHIQPGDEDGWRPDVQMIPGGRGIAIVNRAQTVANGRSRIEVDRAGYDGPIVIRGRLRRGQSGVWRAVPVADPARYAAAVFSEVLESRGVRVGGSIRSVHDPAASPVTNREAFAPSYRPDGTARILDVHRSPPLLEILKVVNQQSHNFYAEMVLRTVGRTAVRDGSVAGGGRASRNFLRRETGKDSIALRMFDGSGLSVLNRVTPRAMITLLGYMAGSPTWDAYWTTLPEAGTSRGLRRMYRTAAEGNLRAKTGTIDGVSALSGYVRAANGELLAFSIISNDVPSTWKAKRVEDAIGARLAAFNRPLEPTMAKQLMPAPGVVSLPVDSTNTPPRYHRVRKGETMESIARRYGTTVDALRDANPNSDPRRLLPGQSLRLP